MDVGKVGIVILIQSSSPPAVPAGKPAPLQNRGVRKLGVVD
jgi:hypothetical protein